MSAQDVYRENEVVRLQEKVERLRAHLQAVTKERDNAKAQLFGWRALLGVTHEDYADDLFFLALSEYGRKRAWDSSGAAKDIAEARAQLAASEARCAALTEIIAKARSVLGE